MRDSVRLQPVRLGSGPALGPQSVPDGDSDCGCVRRGRRGCVARSAEHGGGLAANDNGFENGRLELTLGDGFSAFGDRHTMTPELGLRLSKEQREFRLGWRLGIARSGPASFDLEAVLREAAGDNAAPENAIRLELRARF